MNDQNVQTVSTDYCKRKPPPLANSPPIDRFSVYDETGEPGFMASIMYGSGLSSEDLFLRNRTVAATEPLYPEAFILSRLEPNAILAN